MVVKSENSAAITTMSTHETTWRCLRSGENGPVEDPRVHFSADRAVFDRAAARFTTEAARIHHVLPTADVQHVGGTAIVDCRTKGDLDIQVRVPTDGIATAIAALASLYDEDPANPPAEGRSSFLGGGDPPVGVHLTAIGSGEDKFSRYRDVLLSRSDIRQRLDQLKARYEGRSIAEYREAKAAFFLELEDEVAPGS
jgi:GrpB-like predicted nucleotidyltransferase (UPF0157 family)